jgi:type I restriction enzyme S subunit
MENQLEIVEYLDFIYDNIIKKNIEKIEDIKKLNKYYLSLNISFNTELEIKTLGDVCEIENGTRIVKKDCENGEYPVYGGGDISFYTNKYNREGLNIIISRFAISAKCVRMINNKFYLNDSGFTIISNNNEILLNKYLGYYLLNNQNKIYMCATGTAQLNLQLNDFKEIKIPIPSMEKQLEIVEYLDFNNDLIKTLEKENEINKKNAEQLLKNVLYKD